MWLRGTVWQFRIKVPRDCVATVGRELIYRSLRTSDYREAIRQARIVAFEIEQMIRSGERVSEFPCDGHLEANGGTTWQDGKPRLFPINCLTSFWAARIPR
ncbi:DUF6538 domain-containing protein, partial [Rhodoblastus acidophilus]|uniref:DUF6538 domain-containing protein n=1 Tax=Rhodoblastus acidophilus TaxID=1074 RepID=UPI003CC872EF